MEMGQRSPLTKLEACKGQRERGDVKSVEKLLTSLKTFECSDVESLARFHDALLFLRAFPHSRRVVELTEKLLAGIPRQVKKLADSGASLDLLDSEQLSGMAGTTVEDTFTYDVAHWLVER